MSLDFSQHGSTTSTITRHRPERLKHIASIGVDKMGSIADASENDMLRLENLDTDILPDKAVIDRTKTTIIQDSANSYLPFVGQINLREEVARHVSKTSGCDYTRDNVIVSAGGLSGILNVLLATIEVGDEVIVTDPTYAGLLNRIRLAGGIPKTVEFIFTPGGEWRFDRDSLEAAITSKTRAMLLMSPSMPTGGVLDYTDWKVVSQLCIKHDLLLINDAAMERLLFKGAKVIHPASFPGMAERTITIGAASKELRMIGWRVGWIVAPTSYIPDITAVSLANVVVPVGIAQDAAAVGLVASYETLLGYVDELEKRAEFLAQELKGLPFGRAAGGWSMLLRVSKYGLTGTQMAQNLLKVGVCATPMTGWGKQGDEYIRFVFANESVERLKGFRSKIDAALTTPYST
jgi:N-succinyldiaminopimelate aminotransferase